MISVVLDTNVFVSAFVFGGKPLRVVRLAEARKYRLAISDALRVETEQVLLRKFRWSQTRVAQACDPIWTIADIVVPRTVIAAADDPDDNRVLECAWDAHASAITTWALVAATLWLVGSQTRTSRADLRVRIHLQMEGEFDGESMQAKRATLARQLLSGAEHREIKEDVPNFFESLGVLDRKQLLDDDLLWNTFSYYASRWWSILQPYVVKERERKREQRGSETFFVEFERLAAKLYAMEAKRKKWVVSEVEPSEAEKTEFLDEESKG